MMNQEDNILTRGSTCDIVYKVVVIGESLVGKTSILRQYEDPDNISNPTPTIGIDYRTTDIIIDGLRVRAQLWDTIGKSGFRTMTSNFFRHAKGVLLVFDVTDISSFLALHHWINSIKKYELDKEEVFVVGNKIDLEREVSYEEGKSCAMSYGMKYFETSAKTGENVKKVIQQLLYNIKDAHDNFRTGPVCVINNEEWELVENEGDEHVISNLQNAERKSTCRCSCGRREKCLV